jgi:hypothetical protein
MFHGIMTYFDYDVELATKFIFYLWFNISRVNKKFLLTDPLNYHITLSPVRMGCGSLKLRCLS